MEDQIQQNLLDAFHQKRKMQDALDGNVKKFFSKKVNDNNISKLSLQQNNSIADFLTKSKQEFVDAKQKIDGLSTKDPQYAFFRNKMNSVFHKFETLKENVDEFRNDKVNYVTNISDNLVSRGTSVNDRAILNKIYLGEAQLEVDQGGGLNFLDQTGKIPYDQRPSYIAKDYNSADNILQIANDLHKSGGGLNGIKRTMIEQQIKGIIREGGRDTLLSLATDDFIVHGGLGPIPEPLLEVENEDNLFNYVTENYMQVMDNAFRTVSQDRGEKTHKVIDETKVENLGSKGEDPLKVRI